MIPITRDKQPMTSDQKTNMHHHNAQINPIYRKGTNNSAILLIHGFTGTPDCMRYIANYLNKQGFTVYAPLLAGHGSTRENLAQTKWKDWYQTVKNAYQELHEDHPKVFVTGLSLGGVLTLKLAQDFPQTIDAIACLATPVFLSKMVHATLPVIMNSPMRFLYKYQRKADSDAKDPIARKNYWNIKDMPLTCISSLTKLQKVARRNMSKVLCPTLIMHSRYDSTAPYESMNYIAKNVSSSVTELVTLENSFHLITIDYEKDLVGRKVGKFFQRFI